MHGNQIFSPGGGMFLADYGPEPFAADLRKATLQNDAFRTALWTGDHLQLTLMRIEAGGEIGLENHPELDQFLWIERGRGLVKMGARKDSFSYQRQVSPGWCVIIPAGTWHNLVNTGCGPIQLFSLYAPPQHPKGTVQQTPEDAAAAEAAAE